jgi:RNA recognition motif-containing protein
MNFPSLLKTLLIAVVLSLVGFFVTRLIDSNVDTAVAIGIFVGALISPLISTNKNEASVSQEVKTLYVGNLPYRANETAVRQLFAQYGTVHSVRLMKDKNTGKRRGFGFVEMLVDDADAAISALNDTEFQQRTLKIREAKERPDKTESADADSE